MDVPSEEFECLVEQALSSLPATLAARMDNVIILIEDEPPADDPDLLGLYTGVPLTERGELYAGQLPDQITIFRLPILDMCQTAEEVVAEVRITVIHEIAHHFGIDDERLAALGYD